MKRCLLVTLADRNFIDQAKQFFSSVYWNAGWDGDYMLLAHEIPEEELKWFRNKGILIKKCSPLYNKNFSRWPNTVLSKFFLFTPYFKKWKNIILLDADIIVRASLDDLIKVKGFAAVKGHNTLSKLFLTSAQIKFSKKNMALMKELKENYKFNEAPFSAGLMAFNTEIIKKDDFDKLGYLFKRYHEVCAAAEDSISNLFFYKKWQRLDDIYKMNPYYLMKLYRMKPSEITGTVLHFYKDKPWETRHPFYREWKSNLEKAELIDLKKIQPAKETWDQNRINAYWNDLQKRQNRYFYFFYTQKFWAYVAEKIDRGLGLIGLFLKNYHPKLYFQLKNSKKENEK